MSIEYIKGSLTEPLVRGDWTNLIVHGCNMQGAMGSGVAKALYEKWPQVKVNYMEAFKKHKDWTLGSYTVVKVEEDLWVVNMLTQEYYGRDPNRQYVSYFALQLGFQSLADRCRGNDVIFHLPYIGCSLGGGRWLDVEPIVKSTIGKDFKVLIYGLD